MLVRYNCYHRNKEAWVRPAGPFIQGMWNGSVYAANPREALRRFKALTPTAMRHYVVDSRAEGEAR